MFQRLNLTKIDLSKGILVLVLLNTFLLYFRLGFTPHKAEQPPQDIKLHEKEEDKDKKKTGKLT